MRWKEARVRDGELKETTGTKHTSDLTEHATSVRLIHNAHESCYEVERVSRKWKGRTIPGDKRPTALVRRLDESNRVVQTHHRPDPELSDQPRVVTLPAAEVEALQVADIRKRCQESWSIEGIAINITAPARQLGPHRSVFLPLFSRIHIGMPLKTIADPNVRTELTERVKTLESGLKPHWGRMTAHQMLCHCTDSFKVVVGEKHASSVVTPLNRMIIRHIALRVPREWPKELPTRPEVEQGKGGTPPVEFAADRRALLAELERFSAPGFDLRSARTRCSGNFQSGSASAGLTFTWIITCASSAAEHPAHEGHMFCLSECVQCVERL